MTSAIDGGHYQPRIPSVRAPSAGPQEKKMWGKRPALSAERRAEMARLRNQERRAIPELADKAGAKRKQGYQE